MSIESIPASPTKAFFVEMLTRDILLDDAILDLLDNCIDGIQRSAAGHPGQTPYEGFEARIDMSPTAFSIRDNCGGIPLEDAREYVMKQGRPIRPPDRPQIDQGLYVIGSYGIGMKRAVFKMGTDIEIHSYRPKETFTISISPEWLADREGNDWYLPLELKEPEAGKTGTEIYVRCLHPTISKQFNETFEADIRERIAFNYSYIMSKGFRVFINELEVVRKNFELLWGVSTTGEEIAPYFFESRVGDVEISLCVGLYRPLPTADEEESETRGTKHSKELAGWTVVCNDRVVLLCDKSRATGWGENGAPRYHPQFTAITGLVEFRSQNPLSLPLTTTKRGIDATSEVYLFARQYMIEGLKLFTGYTNKWKKNLAQAKVSASMAESVDPRQAKSERIEESSWKKIKTTYATEARKYTPSLPEPRVAIQADPLKEIKFRREESKIRLIAGRLLENEDALPAQVGELCFDETIKRLT